MGYRNYSVANSFTVDKLGNGDFTTIGAALTASVSGQTIFIRPGTYTENPTLKAGVNLAAFDCDSFTPNVTINGKCTFTAAGTVSISGINLQTNSDFCLAITGSAASVVNLFSCNINALNNTGISFSSSSASALLLMESCNGNIGTTGIAIFAHSSSGTFRILHSLFLNSGNSTTANTVSAGFFFPNYTGFTNPITTSGSTAVLQGSHNVFNTASTNVTAITVNSTSANVSTLDFSEFNGNTASCVSIGSGGSLKILNSTLFSGNTNVITGAGTLVYSNLSFTSSNAINTTTQTPLSVAFQSYVTTNVTNVTGDGTAYTIIFNATAFDQGSHFNTSTGTFTAPITGRYLLSTIVTFGNLGAAHTSGLLEIITTASTYAICLGNPFVTSVSGQVYWNGSILANMTAGDTAIVQLKVSGSTKTVTLASGGGSASLTTTFSGHLVS